MSWTCTNCGRTESDSVECVMNRQTLEARHLSCVVTQELGDAVATKVDADKRIEAEKQRRGLDVLKQKSEQHGAQVCTTDGKPPDADYAELGNAPKPVKANGQHESYYILCESERAKGFVLPVRDSYLHVGIRPKYPVRDLTEEEKTFYASYGYVKYEKYPEGETAVGRFWTAQQLRSGCNSRTTMGRALAETYSRDPAFYGATMCCHCHNHFPVGENGEFVWEDGTRVGGKEDLAALEASMKS